MLSVVWTQFFKAQLFYCLLEILIYVLNSVFGTDLDSIRGGREARAHLQCVHLHMYFSVDSVRKEGFNHCKHASSQYSKILRR